MIILSTVVIAGVALAAVLVQRMMGGIYVPPSMQGKVVLITGGTAGLGCESAKRLAAAGAEHVIVTARTDEKGRKAVQEVKEYMEEQRRSSGTGAEATVSYRVLQLDDLESTKAVAQWVDDLPTIDVLMLNAGIMALPSLESTAPLGIERQMHTNHLGHFIVTALLRPKLASDARVIVVSSEAHKIAQALGGGLDLEYAWKPSASSYGGWKSYGMSKLANIYFAAQLDQKLGDSMTAVSMHPGEVNTNIAQNVISGVPILQQLLDSYIFPIAQKLGVLQSVAQGANTQVYLASVSGDQLVGGAYYKDQKVTELAAFATDTAVSERLWKESEEISGIAWE